MKMRKVVRGSMGVIGAYRFVIRRHYVDRRDCGWWWAVYDDHYRYGSGLVKMLGRAKLEVTRAWLGRRLIMMQEAFAGERELLALLAACRTFKDAVAPSALADRLDEVGLTRYLRPWVLDGRRAAVAWPEGWQAVAARFRGER